MKMPYILLKAQYMDTVDMLDDESAGRLFKTLLHHANDDDDANFAFGEQKLVYSMMVKSIDQQAQKYADTCEKRRQAINTRWNKRIQEDTNVSDSTDLQPHVLNTKTKTKSNTKTNTKSKQQVQEKRKRFIPPTLQEVEQYCQENGININAAKFWFNYDSKNWYIGKTKMTNWHSAVKKWELDNDTQQAPRQQASGVRPYVNPFDDPNL